MTISYNDFISVFLQKITEWELLSLAEAERDEAVIGYMKRSIAGFRKNCKYDLISTCDDVTRTFDVDVAEEDFDELAEIISEGMVCQWLKPYVYRQELLENAISTKDFSVYSPAELLLRVGNAYKQARKDYTQMIREYSYNHGDLTDLHL